MNICYLACWTSLACSTPEYYVEKVFSSREKAEEFIIKNPAPSGNDDGWWIEEKEIN